MKWQIATGVLSLVVLVLLSTVFSLKIDRNSLMEEYEKMVEHSWKLKNENIELKTMNTLYRTTKID